MSAVALRPVTRDNWEAIANLEVAPEQASFVWPNVYSIAESRFEPAYQLRGIYADDEPVGFAMYGKHPETGLHWIVRFMIDRHHQRRGYGRAALALLIDEMCSIPDLREIWISYEPENTVAQALYQAFGFVEAGMAPWGEMTARLDLAR